MLIDTHCHLDAPAFAPDRAAVIQRAWDHNLQAIVIPAVDIHNFAAVRQLAHSHNRLYYALGIHPMYVARSDTQDLDLLAQQLAQYKDDPRLVAIGEIGLDFYLPELKTPESRRSQENFYAYQLELAQEFNLPVLLHVRKSQDILLKHLRQRPNVSGIAHAFNGSMQQAEQFLELGFALGLGGAMTFARARQIRRLATDLPLSAFVLETDAPDMAPEWLVRDQGKSAARNEPFELSAIAQVLAQLRNISLDMVLQQTATNARRALPRLNLNHIAC